MTLTTDPPAPGRRGPDPLTKWAIAAIIVFGLAVLFAKLAHAAADPSTALTSSTDAAWEIFRVNGPWWAGFLVLFAALQTFLSRQHWLAQGRILATLTGVAMVAAAVAKWHFGGAPSAGIMTAAVTAIALIWHPTVAPVATAKPGSGTAAMLVVLLLGGLAGSTLTGCATAPAAIVSGTSAFITCEDGHLSAKDLADFKEMASAELRHLLSGGPAVDTTALKADLAPLKSDLARCGWAAAIAAVGALVPTPTPGTAISALSSSTPAPAAVRAQFSIAARAAGWPLMQLAGGDTL